MPKAQVLRGDCRAVMRTLAPDSVHAIVTDPPSGIHFMGAAWDSDKGGRDQWIAWMQGVAEEAMRVLKPGGHALVWALPRTSHWTATAWENAGFEVRDRVAHIFSTGFPKSLDVSKALDRMAGAEREVTGVREYAGGHVQRSSADKLAPPIGTFVRSQDDRIETAPATAAAREWQGWHTALKPSVEDWWLLRKPLSEKTVAANVLRHGTGALNIDKCRVEAGDDHAANCARNGVSGIWREHGSQPGVRTEASPLGRWPSHLIHDGSDEVVRAFPSPHGAGAKSAGGEFSANRGSVAVSGGGVGFRHGDSGSAARFFQACPPDASRIAYFPKASRADRDAGLEGVEPQTKRIYSGGIPSAVNSDPRGMSGGGDRQARNHHPTVKPTSLMRYLCRLVTPSGGTVLDCFAGSGSTGRGAVLEGFSFIGIEQNAEFAAIARKRIAAAQREARTPAAPPARARTRTTTPTRLAA